MERTKKRNGFASGIGFILAAAGSAIGLGNLWSFPYKTSENGGAGFVLTYILSVIVMGSIVMIAEIYIGKRAQANPVSAYKKVNKNLGWLGLFAVIVPLIILCYYSVLGGYTVKYTLNSFNRNSEILASFTGNIPEVIMYTAIFLVLAVAVVMGGVKNGIEKVSKILMPALFVILFLTAVYCLCLGEGVKDGLNYYLNPDFTALGFTGVLAAMSQAFFSLSLGMGIMVSYGSYAGKEINVGKSVSMICVFDTLVALFAGLAIFPAIYHYRAVYGVELTDRGIVLLFSSLPLVFDNLGWFGEVVSFFFFGMVSIAAITSVISLLEVVTQFVIQKFGADRKKAILIVAAICFAVSVPVSISLGFALNAAEGTEAAMQIFGLNLLDFLDMLTNSVLMPLCALGSCLAIGWLLSPSRGKTAANPSALKRELEQDGLKLGKFGGYFAVMVKYITPLLIAAIEVFGVIDIVFPSGEGGRIFSSDGLGVVLTAYILFALTIAVYFIFFRNRYTGCNADERLREDFSASADVVLPEEEKEENREGEE